MSEISRTPECCAWWREQRDKYDGQPRLKMGQKVLTVEPKYILEGDWTSEALQERRWGVLGEVCGISDSHGLCYAVRHTGHSVAFYDPWELEVQ